MRSYERTTDSVKKWALRLSIGGAVLYTCLTGCNDYIPVNLETRTEQGIVVGAVQTRIPERPRPEMVLALRDGTNTMNKQQWRNRMIDQILANDDLDSDLHRLATNYIPNRVYPAIGKSVYRNHHQFCRDLFLDRFSHYSRMGCSKVFSRDFAVEDVVTKVLCIREDCYQQ